MPVHNRVKPLKAGVSLTALFDSCKAGSIMDLPYGPEKHYLVLEMFRTIGAYALGDIERVVKLWGRLKSWRAVGMRYSPANVVCWSSCEDHQISVEREGGGVMTRTFLTFLRAYPEATRQELLDGIKKCLREEGYKQVPEVSSSKPLGKIPLRCFIQTPFLTDHGK
jgi:hypothetical protein